MGLLRFTSKLHFAKSTARLPKKLFHMKAIAAASLTEEVHILMLAGLPCFSKMTFKKFTIVSRHGETFTAQYAKNVWM